MHNIFVTLNKGGMVMTLRELWESKNMSPTRVAGLAGITTTTLYKMNRKQRVAPRTIEDVCRVLGISLQQYEQLDASK